MKYSFLNKLASIVNSGQSRIIATTGNITDLFYINNNDFGEYVPFFDFIVSKWDRPTKIIVHYDLNGSIQFVNEQDKKAMDKAWKKWKHAHDDSKTGKNYMPQKTLKDHLVDSTNKPFASLEILRQICQCRRETNMNKKLIIIIENANMIIPEVGDISRMSDIDRRRVGVCREWFSDPEFMNGGDTVILTSESRSQINQAISRLPQMAEAEIPSPNTEERAFFIEWFKKNIDKEKHLKIKGGTKKLSESTAGLSIHALRQLLIGACFSKKPIDMNDVVGKVEQFIKSQVGDDVVEFKKPSHTLKDVVGFSNLKKFLNDELIPRMKSSGEDAISGAAIAGPIGGGKTFAFEAVAGQLDMPVLILKNLRSQFFGQTDVIFGRLQRAIVALEKVVIFVDEADTQFGGVGSNTHDTERRLTGKIQAMMSDVSLKGKVIWLLMTARINLLSADIRRPGRVGDLIIPVLDPKGEDLEAFVKWMLKPSCDQKTIKEILECKTITCEGFSAAAFASIRSELIAKKREKRKLLNKEEIKSIMDNILMADISEEREYQTLQALVNCTRKNLIDESCSVKDIKAKRTTWHKKIKELEIKFMEE